MDVFLHIPKSAGSTLRAIISREYGSDRVLYYEPKVEERDATTQSAFLERVIAKRGIRLITGHYPYGIHALIRVKCRYFSLVRDPVKRALSDYFYAYSYPHHRFRNEIRSGQISLEQYLTEERFSPGGGQATMLATGRWDGASLPENAMENVRFGFAAVGTAERFAESILQIAKALRWRPPLFALKNVTRLDDERQAERERAEARARERFSEHFKIDYRVYEAIDALLSERIAADGASFTRAIEAFHEMQDDIAAHARDSIFELYEFHGDDALPEAAARYVASEPYRHIEDYLQRDEPVRRPERNYVGHLDLLEGQVVAGWGADLAGEKPIYVTIWRGDTAIATAYCDVPREDLLVRGYRTDRMGFRCYLEEPIRDAVDYRVCFEDTKIELW